MATGPVTGDSLVQSRISFPALTRPRYTSHRGRLGERNEIRIIDIGHGAKEFRRDLSISGKFPHSSRTTRAVGTRARQ